MSNPMVLEAQRWLNRTYGDKTGFGSVTENGKTGWATINALIRALQIELGITSTANTFGPGNQTRFKNHWPNGINQNTTDNNVHGIIQCALWCKGYPAEYGGITGRFTSNVADSIRTLKSDIGIANNSSTIDLELMMVLLSMKQFRLLADYGGKLPIRAAQQSINRQYKNYTGIIPTDGLYGREMNTALIQVLQAIQGFTPAQATGNFGDGTRSRLQTINGGTSQWVWLATVALICNGYSLSPTSTWNSGIADHIKRFQQVHALPVTGKVDPTTWMSLLTSKGDPERDCVACDTRFQITDELAEHLKADGYQIVGRYLSEVGIEDLLPEQYFKAIGPGELRRILDHGLKYFPIFQEYSTALRHFTPETGARHAAEAQASAQRLRIPPTTIYFAVDYDATDPEVTTNILPYFRAVSAGLAGNYRVGIYASRNVCQRVIDAGYAVNAFVSDMSTGFSGNLGFRIPEMWNYDQFHEIRRYKGKWDLDRVAWSGLEQPCSTLLPASVAPTPDPDPGVSHQDPLWKWVAETERQCVEAMSGFMNPLAPYKSLAGQFILEWLRKPKYWGDKYLGLWRLYTPEVAYPSDLAAARAMCAQICSSRPEIRGTIPRRDIEHLAASMLGYLTWGLAEDHADYGLGDLGGWGLDLLQIWGVFDNSSTTESLASWLRNHLGKLDDSSGFDYEDLLADADAWLLVKAMQGRSGDTRLADAMREVLALSETNRIQKFYRERFGGSANNLAESFAKLADGIDVWGFENFEFGKNKLLSASGASRLPDVGEAHVLGRTYAAILSRPNRGQ